MTAELIALTEELRVTTVMLGKVIVRLDEADKRANTHRVWTIVLALCVAALFLLALFTFSVAKDSQTALDQLDSDRTAARLISCEDFNRQQAISRSAERAQIRAVLGAREVTPRIAEILKRHDEQIDASYLDRDCSSAGIAAYFDNDDTTDPYVPPEG